MNAQTNNELQYIIKVICIALELLIPST